MKEKPAASTDPIVVGLGRVLWLVLAIVVGVLLAFTIMSTSLW